MASITLDNVDLTFRVRRQRALPLKDIILHRLTGQKSNHPVVEMRSLRNISARFENGARVGIIGHNGAGKSTLLKMIAGVYAPAAGKCIVEGRISGLFDLMLGFEAFASGRDNIRFRGYLMGETPATLEPKIDSIIEFAELGDFIDTPVRYYSSGMKMRLGFSIATSVEPEILLMDECFSAGDRSFKRKASARLKEMMNKASLIVMVSHDLKLLARLADRVIWLSHGGIYRDGPAAEVIEEYKEFMTSNNNVGVGADIKSAA